MLSAQRRYRHPDFGLLENPNDLLLGEPALSHDDGLHALRPELIAGIPRGGKVKGMPRKNCCAHAILFISHCYCLLFKKKHRDRLVCLG